MQPHGYIEANASGVRNRDREQARQQFSGFLSTAIQTGADLAITPEYSMPWDVLVHAIKNGATPHVGKLWVLGCESITYDQLAVLKGELAAFATIIYEPLPTAPNHFVDPLTYVFWAPPADGVSAAKLVLLVQFKTSPMVDNDHFEVNALQCGTQVYQFGIAGQTIRLVSLVCSDSFGFLDAEASLCYDRALFIHIQLNAKPRHPQYRLYRDRLFRFDNDATELICLNWAGDIREWYPDEERSWNNIAGSAWYLKSNDRFDDRDTTLSANHLRGMYYTWHSPLHLDALFFNYAPAVYLLRATKVFHLHVAAPRSRRRGPQLVTRFVWDPNAPAWIEQVSADDGLSAIVHEAQNARDEIMRLSTENPFAAERVLALCAGKIVHDIDWHDVRELDSCEIDASEIIRRMTFCQDPAPEAAEFRIARLRRCGRLWEILQDKTKLPPSLADLSGGCRLEWRPDYPHHNVVSNEGRRATLVLMGDESGTGQIEAIAKIVADFLHRTSSDPASSLDARQRLAVWFRDTKDQIAYFPMDRYIRIDKTGDTSEFNIAREQ